MPATKALTIAEASALARHESMIERGRSTFIEVGRALLKIRDGRLYRQGYGTFEEYCQDRWHWGRKYVNKQIAAAEVVGEMTPIGVIPATESQARPLTSLSPEQRADAWARAVESLPPGKAMTAAHVERVVRPLVNKPSVVSARGEISSVQASPSSASTTFNRTNSNVDWAWWTWNPVTGCLHDCPYCYARDIAIRHYPQRFVPTFHADRLAAPRNIKPPTSNDPRSRRVFTCSMADLFGKWVPQEWIDAVFDQVRDHPEWEFLFLTKFPQRLAELEWPDNAWVGTTVDRQHRVEIAERSFRGVKAGVKWLSCEPMLEPLRFTSLDMFDLVVIGGASRSSQTPEFWPPLEWVIDLIAQARGAGCNVYLKSNAISGATPVPKELPRTP